MTTRRLLLRGFAAAGLAATGRASAADDFPSRPVKLVVVYPPGGGIDIVARRLGERLAAEWKQPVIVENRPGAGTTIGAAAVAKSPADGHTLLMTDVSFCISPALYKQLPYDPIKDFAPVTLINLVPDVLVVGPDVPARSLRDLVEMAKREPGKLTYASAGNGTLNHLAPDMLRAQAGIQVLHVPYNGAVAALNEVMAGRAQFYVGALNSTLPLIRAGRVRAIAMTGARRSPLLPDVPTLIESGLPGYDVAAWYGLLAPAGTPRGALDRISRDLVKVLRDPEVKAVVENDGNEVVAGTPAEFASFIGTELAKWRKAAADAGVTIQ